MVPYAIYSGMHGKEVANLGSFPGDTTNKAFGKTSQVKAMNHMETRNSTLNKRNRAMIIQI